MCCSLTVCTIYMKQLSEESSEDARVQKYNPVKIIIPHPGKDKKMPLQNHFTEKSSWILCL